MTRTNSWTNRRRRRRRRPSQARILARWTGSCGNILLPRGGPDSPLARPSHFPHPRLRPFRPTSPLLSGPDPSGQSPDSLPTWLSSGHASPLPSDPASPLSLSPAGALGASLKSVAPRGPRILVGRPARRPQERAGGGLRLVGPSLLHETSPLSSPLPPHALRLALPWAPDHSIPPMRETGLYSGMIGGRRRGEPPLSN